ncbi:IS701 family transposase [Streptomyces violaceoruber]|uniref:IS701 family transposase n=1 Tax=Streptomyces violaceoruber TaxID=1935 RepID=UPI00403CE3DD
MPVHHPGPEPWACGPSGADADFTGFVDDVFGCLPRRDQRRWAGAYLHGLLTVQGKKTIQRMARAATTAPGASPALQQFISASPWDWNDARAALARKAAAHLPNHAWTIGVVLAEKRGEHTVGVHRRFVAETGRTLNCQVGIGLFLTSATASVPVDWQLLLDENWSGDPRRRLRARIPSTVGAQPVWAHVLDLCDRLASLRLSASAPLVVDRRAATDTARLALHLALRERDFLIEVRPDQRVLPVGRTDRGTRVGHLGQQPVSAHQHLRGIGTRHPFAVAEGPHGRARHVDVSRSLVRLPGALGVGALGAFRLLAEHSPGRRRATRYWITNLVDRRVDQLLALLQRPDLTRVALQGLQDDFGLLDFEGRSFPGWHHHMTMASAAGVYSHLTRDAHRGALTLARTAGT